MYFLYYKITLKKKGNNNHFPKFPNFFSSFTLFWTSNNNKSLKKNLQILYINYYLKFLQYSVLEYITTECKINQKEAGSLNKFLLDNIKSFLWITIPIVFEKST